MAANPEKIYYTLTRLQNSGRWIEYDHGEIYVMAGSSTNHVRIPQNMWRALDDALGDEITCVAYMVDRVVTVAEEVRFLPDVVVSCATTDHGEAFFSGSAPSCGRSVIPFYRRQRSHV